jgi:hypothetical protein
LLSKADKHRSGITGRALRLQGLLMPLSPPSGLGRERCVPRSCPSIPRIAEAREAEQHHRTLRIALLRPPRRRPSLPAVPLVAFLDEVPDAPLTWPFIDSDPSGGTNEWPGAMVQLHAPR